VVVLANSQQCQQRARRELSKSLNTASTFRPIRGSSCDGGARRAGFDPTPRDARPRVSREVAQRPRESRSAICANDEDILRAQQAAAPATPADQAARYVSLALALGQRRASSSRTFRDLPPDFWKCSISRRSSRSFIAIRIDEHMVEYVRAYQAEGDRCVRRRPRWSVAADYLHTRPITSLEERVEVKNPNKKSKEKTYTYGKKSVAF
jgi:hypothetical protein